LSDDKTKDRYNRHDFRAKINDGEVFKVAAFQDWGSEFFRLFIFESDLRHAQKFTIQMNHYGDGLRHYSFDMTTFDIVPCL